jgi:hypothetical protein
MLQRAAILIFLSLGAATPAFAAPVLTYLDRELYAYAHTGDWSGYNGSITPMYAEPGLFVGEAAAMWGTGTGSALQTSTVDATGLFSGTLSGQASSSTGATYVETSNVYFVGFDLLSPHAYTVNASFAGSGSYTIFDLYSSRTGSVFEEIGDTRYSSRQELWTPAATSCGHTSRQTRF